MKKFTYPIVALIPSLNKRKIMKRGGYILSLIVIICLVLPTIRASAYSVLSGDDYSHGVHIESFNVPFPEYFLASLSYMKKEYMTWQGTYFSMFIQALLSPINNWGMPQLRVVMVINSILTFSSILFFIWTLIKSALKKEYLFLFLPVCICAIYCITAYNPYVEVFYQFSCAVSYTYPLAFSLGAIGLLVLYNNNRRAIVAILSCVLGFLSAGGSLSVAGFTCYMGLLVCLYYFTINNNLKMRISNSIIFISWLSGAMINAIAPGNYVRHNQIDSTGLHPIEALKTAFIEYENRFNYYASETDFIFVLLILIICGIIVTKERKINIQKYLIVSVLFLFSPVVTAFPLSLGYSNFVYASFPSRVVFIIDISFILAYGNIAICIGVLLGNRLRNIEMRYILICMILLLMLVDIGADGFSSYDLTFRKIEKGLQKGTYQNYYSKCLRFYEYLDTFENGNIVISYEQFPQPIDDFMCLALSDDPEYYVNIAVSKYYGFDSLIVQKEEN